MRGGVKPLRIAWFSELNCGSTAGSSRAAYFSDVLLPLLRPSFEIELFHNSAKEYRDFPTFHYLRALERHAVKPFDIFFYQIEDRRESSFARMHLGLMPGIVLFHDFFFTERGAESLIESSWEGVVDCFNQLRKELPKRDYVELTPPALRESALSAIALFTNERQHGEFSRLAQKRISVAGEENCARSYFIPFPVETFAQDMSGSSPKKIVYSGSVRIDHRAHKLLEALSNINVDYQFVWLLEESELEKGRELLREFGIDGAKVKFVCGRSPQMWRNELKGADIAVHTLFSAYGQLGPYLQMSLMAGVPSIVNSFATDPFLPDRLIFKIESGEHEAYELWAVLEKLLCQDLSLLRTQIGAYALENFDSQQVARELSSVFVSSQPYLEKVSARWKEIEKEARSELLKSAIGAKEDSEAAHLIDSAFEELGWRA